MRNINFLMKPHLILIVLSIFLYQCKKDAPYNTIDLAERYLAGGATTVFLSSSNAYSTPAANLSAMDLAMHLDGDFQFEAAFVTAPATVNAGVGPLFNNTSCVSCHPRDGRPAFPSDLNALSGFFLRSSLPGVSATGAPIAVPGFGAQLQHQAIFGYIPEVKFDVSYSTIVESFADGTSVSLLKPTYHITQSYIPFPSNALLSPRIAPPVFGLGLLEAIPESHILAIQSSQKAPISGKANYVYDAVTGSTKIGRFGWKANTASILEQCAGAYVHDMGITNPLFTQETGYDQSNGADGYADDPEISQAILDQVTFYCQTLAVPAPRNIENEIVQGGAFIFEQIGCAECHTPMQKSGASPIAALANQTFYPYTDMLLHDMGPDLADMRPDYLATGTEWRTRPLWGIGLQQIVNGHTHFMHDGRAKNLTEAILWHGGEAEQSKNEFKQLSTADRNALLQFLNAL